MSHFAFFGLLIMIVAFIISNHAYFNDWRKGWQILSMIIGGWGAVMLCVSIVILLWRMP